MGHLNSVSDPGEGNLTAENKKNSNARGGMLNGLGMGVGVGMVVTFSI